MIWFHCEAKMIRRSDGRPWFIHGVAFDITELKQTEAALEQERNVASAIIHTLGALVAVLDPQGRIVRFNRACERTTGYTFAEVQGLLLGDLFLVPEEAGRFDAVLEQLTSGAAMSEYEGYCGVSDGRTRSFSQPPGHSTLRSHLDDVSQLLRLVSVMFTALRLESPGKPAF